MPKHILVIDDEAVIREMLTEVLTVSGYQVTAVATGAEAINVVRRIPVQLIFSDLQLEDSDGLDLISQLKMLQPGTPVILLTGVLFDPQVVAEILGSKVTSYLDKTCSLSRILEEVHRLIGPA